MTDKNSAAKAAANEIHEGFELSYGTEADNPANATELSHFANGWRACIMSTVRAEGVQAGDGVADERAAFEYHARACELTRDEDAPDEYRNSHVQEYWSGWKARAALASAPVAGEAISDKRLWLMMAPWHLQMLRTHELRDVTEFGRAAYAAGMADAAPQDSEAVRNAAPLEKLEAWQAVCDRIVEQYGGVVAGVDFASLGRANRAALAAQPKSPLEPKCN